MTDRAILELLLSRLDEALRRPGIPPYAARGIEDAIAEADAALRDLDGMPQVTAAQVMEMRV